MGVEANQSASFLRGLENYSTESALDGLVSVVLTDLRLTFGLVAGQHQKYVDFAFLPSLFLEVADCMTTSDS